MSTLTNHGPESGASARRRVWPVGLRSLAHRNYRLFFSGQLISVIGTWMQSVAQAWFVYRLTGSELLLGLVGFADKIPVFLLGLVGGLVADRLDRRKIVITTQAAAMLQALVLAVLVLGGRAEVWHIFVLAVFQGIVNAFDLPARQSFISAMVERDDLPNALALNSSVFNAARIIGPALAGVIVALGGEGICFLLNAVSYLGVIAVLGRMRVDPGADPGHAATPSTTSERLMGGLDYARKSLPIRSLLILLGISAVFGMPYTVLMPVFAGEILGGGARGLGLLMGASGLGAFAGAVVLARRKSVQGLGRVIAAGGLGFGVSLIFFALSRHFFLSASILVVAGFWMITQAAATNLLIQSLCPDSLRGRLMSLYTIMLIGMGPWGSILAGALAHRFGAPATVAFGGCVCVLASIIFAARIPSMRTYVRYPIPESPPGPRRGAR